MDDEDGETVVDAVAAVEVEAPAGAVDGAGGEVTGAEEEEVCVEDSAPIDPAPAVNDVFTVAEADGKFVSNALTASCAAETVRTLCEMIARSTLKRSASEWRADNDDDSLPPVDDSSSILLDPPDEEGAMNNAALLAARSSD